MRNSKDMVFNLIERHFTIFVTFRAIILTLGCLVYEFKIF